MNEPGDPGLKREFPKAWPLSHRQAEACGRSRTSPQRSALRRCCSKYFCCPTDRSFRYEHFQTERCRPRRSDRRHGKQSDFFQRTDCVYIRHKAAVSPHVQKVTERADDDLNSFFPHFVVITTEFPRLLYYTGRTKTRSLSCNCFCRYGLLQQKAKRIAAIIFCMRDKNLF